jgi:hypothetical protein
MPNRTSTRCTPEALIGTPAVCSSAAMRAGPACGRGVAARCGPARPATPARSSARVGWSGRPAQPAPQRVCHLDRHWRDTPASATWARGRPASTRRHRRRRPSTVSGALAWDLPAVGVGAFSSTTPRPEVLPMSRSSSSCPRRHQPPWVGHLERQPTGVLLLINGDPCPSAWVIRQQGAVAGSPLRTIGACPFGAVDRRPFVG